MGGGVVFLVCIPTPKYEHTLLYGQPPKDIPALQRSNTLLRLEVELRDKKKRQQHAKTPKFGYVRPPPYNQFEEYIPMEKVLEELLKKLEIEHAVWCLDKDENYFEVFFPVPAGNACENCIHCLTELGIGTKLNSVVSVMPCSVTYNALESSKMDFRTKEQKKTWESFVDSVRSKLTVKQVIDGVRSGGEMTFDYLMLVLTADCLAALGLIENNASNIVAAMLVSPLMGPVMSLTFGTIVADHKLQWTGLKSLVVGMFISCVFGFIFGLILGTTEMPWGGGDFPTEEMKGRGNVRSLWMGVLWALPSGTGVALALLQGSAGPLIGVAISASLLPPVVNCGLFWALSCTWLLNKDIPMPYIKGEPLTSNTTYQCLYSDYIPIEFLINGIVSGCLTVVNVICIFITAIIVLKIKEVAAPYTSTPDLRRFWEHDIKMVRDTNRSPLQAAEEQERQEYLSNLNMTTDNERHQAVEAAVREAMQDETFKKVQRSSYNLHVPEELPGPMNLHVPSNRNSGVTDLAALDKLITSLLGTQSKDVKKPTKPGQSSLARGLLTNVYNNSTFSVSDERRAPGRFRNANDDGNEEELRSLTHDL